MTMAKRKKTKIDVDVDLILNTLRQGYLPGHPQAQIDGYRYNPWSIRVRIIDPDVKGTNITARDREAWAILEPLPDDVIGQISLLMLLAPEETKTSMKNLEFEDPTPSRL
jgi:hypothetical protein